MSHAAQAAGPVDYMLHAYEAAGKRMPAAELLAAYARGPAELEASIAGLTRGQLLERPVPGKWSTLQVIGHLADCEQFLADRMKRTIALERPLLMGVDENKYMAAFDYDVRDAEEELAVIRSTRAQMTRLLGALSEGAWSRAGVHSEAGLMTLHQILFHATNHIRHHVRFIEEKRRAMAPAGG